MLCLQPADEGEVSDACAFTGPRPIPKEWNQSLRKVRLMDPVGSKSDEHLRGSARANRSDIGAGHTIQRASSEYYDRTVPGPWAPQIPGWSDALAEDVAGGPSV